MKYMVLVNRKYMVAVEKDGSNAAAEHMILDNYDGIQGAQAFDRAEMRSNYFADIFQECETVSLAELKQMSDRYTEAYRELSRKHSAVSRIEAEIERVQQMLKDLNHDKAILLKEEQMAKLETIEAKKVLNFKED